MPPPSDPAAPTFQIISGELSRTTGSAEMDRRLMTQVREFERFSGALAECLGMTHLHLAVVEDSNGQLGLLSQCGPDPGVETLHGFHSRERRSLAQAVGDLKLLSFTAGSGGNGSSAW